MRLKVQVWIFQQKLNEVWVLLLKRPDSQGGYWQPVTGGVDSGESLLQAALRESVEETGLAFDVSAEVLGYVHEFESRHGGNCVEHAYRLQVRLAEAPHPRIKLDPEEHTDYRWLSPMAALELLTFESNREGLKRFIETTTKGIS